MSYVDGYVLPVPKKHLSIYKKMASLGRKVWLDHGALDYKECVADDAAIKGFVAYPKMIGAKRNEVVIFAYIVFKSRAHRDKVNASVMKDKRLAAFMDGKNMPFDCKRMAWGGFKTIVE
jgi:uncharacterized protein YbaA (DUF1428 family)